MDPQSILTVVDMSSCVEEHPTIAMVHSHSVFWTVHHTSVEYLYVYIFNVLQSDQLLKVPSFTANGEQTIL